MRFNCEICSRVSLNVVYESLYKIRIVLYHTPVRKINLRPMWNFRFRQIGEIVIFFLPILFYFSHWVHGDRLAWTQLPYPAWLYYIYLINMREDVCYLYVACCIINLKRFRP